MPYTYDYNNSFPFAAFITNLGKYNEGYLVGEWLEFPTTAEKVNEVLKKIGIGSKDEFGNPYEEFFITDYDDYTDCHLSENAGEYASLDELNMLATLLDDMSSFDYKMLCAVLESGMFGSKPCDIINIINSIDVFILHEDIFDNSDYGHYVVQEGLIEVPECLEPYIDYEALGRDWTYDGTFTSYGYLEQIDDVDEYFYDGIETPEEYCVIEKCDEEDE